MIHGQNVFFLVFDRPSFEASKTLQKNCTKTDTSIMTQLLIIIIKLINYGNTCTEVKHKHM